MYTHARAYMDTFKFKYVYTGVCVTIADVINRWAVDVDVHGQDLVGAWRERWAAVCV